MNSPDAVQEQEVSSDAQRRVALTPTMRSSDDRQYITNCMLSLEDFASRCRRITIHNDATAPCRLSVNRGAVGLDNMPIFQAEWALRLGIVAPRFLRRCCLGS